MWHHEIREWRSPLEMAAGIPPSESDWILLHSGLQSPYTGRYSILALRKTEEIRANDFSLLESKLSSNQPLFENAWFGYLGYGLKNCLEELPHDKPWHLDFPNLHLVQFGLILRFDNAAKTLEVFAKTPEDLKHIPSPQPIKKSAAPAIQNLESDMDKKSYLDKVRAVQEAILRGDIYQANLTRKFTGEFSDVVSAKNPIIRHSAASKAKGAESKNDPAQSLCDSQDDNNKKQYTSSANPFDIFTHLCRESPAQYSAFIKFGGDYILSSSPERLITITAEGLAESRPIKGSAARGKDIAEDIFNKEQLQASTKNRSENLMIVDLMRNDISKGSEFGSVRVSDLFDITTYATIHHMSSAVQGKKRSEISTLDMVKHCFPPGSMTGAPKIEAMRLCSTLEPYARGIYSGAVGYFGGDGSVDLSVVIRTILIRGKRFEFQVGGGIVEDSTPEEEWQETLTKAKAIAAALGISDSKLAAL